MIFLSLIALLSFVYVIQNGPLPPTCHLIPQYDKVTLHYLKMPFLTLFILSSYSQNLTFVPNQKIQEKFHSFLTNIRLSLLKIWSFTHTTMRALKSKTNKKDFLYNINFNYCKDFPKRFITCIKITSFPKL